MILRECGEASIFAPGSGTCRLLIGFIMHLLCRSNILIHCILDYCTWGERGGFLSVYCCEVVPCPHLLFFSLFLCCFPSVMILVMSHSFSSMYSTASCSFDFASFPPSSFHCMLPQEALHIITSYAITPFALLSTRRHSFAIPALLLFLLFVYIARTTSETSALGHIQTL